MCDVIEDKDAFIWLMSYDFADPKYIKQPKQSNGVITNKIFDDMLATDAFSRL